MSKVFVDCAPIGEEPAGAGAELYWGVRWWGVMLGQPGVFCLVEECASERVEVCPCGVSLSLLHKVAKDVYAVSN